MSKAIFRGLCVLYLIFIVIFVFGFKIIPKNHKVMYNMKDVTTQVIDVNYTPLKPTMPNSYTPVNTYTTIPDILTTSSTLNTIVDLKSTQKSSGVTSNSMTSASEFINSADNNESSKNTLITQRTSENAFDTSATSNPTEVISDTVTTSYYVKSTTGACSTSEPFESTPDLQITSSFTEPILNPITSKLNSLPPTLQTVKMSNNIQSAMDYKQDLQNNLDISFDTQSDKLQTTLSPIFSSKIMQPQTVLHTTKSLVSKRNNCENHTSIFNPIIQVSSYIHDRTKDTLNLYASKAEKPLIKTYLQLLKDRSDKTKSDFNDELLKNSQIAEYPIISLYTHILDELSEITLDIYNSQISQDRTLMEYNSMVYKPFYKKLLGRIELIPEIFPANAIFDTALSFMNNALESIKSKTETFGIINIPNIMVSKLSSNMPLNSITSILDTRINSDFEKIPNSHIAYVGMSWEDYEGVIYGYIVEERTVAKMRFMKEGITCDLLKKCIYNKKQINPMDDSTKFELLIFWGIVEKPKTETI